MPIGDLLAQITGEPSPTTTAFPPPMKRKAEDDLRRLSEKTQRVELQAANSSRPVVPPRGLSTVEASKSVANGGRHSHPSTATAIFKNGHPTPPSNTDPAKPPKKGSFAEIMARGKDAQLKLGSVGKIQHKKIEKLPSRREREAMQARKGKSIQKALSSNSKSQRTGPPSQATEKNGAKQLDRKTPKEPEKKIKKAALATTGYAGTARPKTGGESASARRVSSSERDRLRRDRLGSRYDRYLSEDEEDDDLEDDEEQDYESESDMEAAAFEVDDEEELAARIARKEDAEALAEENRLKREKEEKKRRLLAMAKKAKPTKY